MSKADRLCILGRALVLAVAGSAFGVTMAVSRGPTAPPPPPPPPPMTAAPISEGQHDGLLPLVMPATQITTNSEFVFKTTTDVAVSGRLAEGATLAVDGQTLDRRSFEAAMASEAPVTVDVRVNREGSISRMEIHLYQGASVSR